MREYVAQNAPNIISYALSICTQACSQCLYISGHLANIAHRNYNHKHERNMDTSVNATACSIVIMMILFIVAVIALNICFVVFS